MRIALLALVFASVVLARPAAADDDDVVVGKWLVLAPVDRPGRRTLRPDAVFAKYLLDRTSAPPKAGDAVTGTLGTPAKWAAREADEKGELSGDEIGWAFASVESAEDRVVLAKLEGAAVLFVNGAGFTGDVYRLGDIGVPVALRKGANDVYVGGMRGGFRLTLVEPDAEDGVVSDRLPSVSPDLHGSYGEGPASRRVMNATNDPRAGDGEQSMVPLGVRRFPVRVMCTLGAPERVSPYRRTFVSNIDGSVQSYAVVPPTPSDIDKTKIGLVLSLHGASVECMSQAKAYAPKPDFWIVCPTNRGNYGFDWQDWGRLDAYEVLADALLVTGVDPRRVYLTGHSMGGHGTWHLAANGPGRFLAIAPSAGWSSFESYGAPKMTTLAWMWRAADGASRTLDLVENLAQVPTYVLHGEKDDNVPASEARLMIDAITKAGGKVESHFEPDAGHWWDKDEKRPGADCVDWPGIWELFRTTQPKDIGPGEEVSWTTMDLSVLNERTLAHVYQAIDYGRSCRITTQWVNHDLIVRTENVRELLIGQFPSFMHSGSARFVIDGVAFTHAGGFERDRTGRWSSPVYDPSGAQHFPKWCEKTPARAGPFKRAFANRFVLVYGTAGDDAEDRELLEKARCDSEVWAYRANGDANLMSDAQFLAGDFADRNVILYGNADTNSAWTAVFDDECPIQAKRGTMTVNGTKHAGVVAAAFVRPRRGSDEALAAAFADTGAAATRLFYQFPVFSSGVGIPDYVVFGPGFLHEFDGDVRAAGWFDYAWRMK